MQPLPAWLRPAAAVALAALTTALLVESGADDVVRDALARTLPPRMDPTRLPGWWATLLWPAVPCGAAAALASSGSRARTLLAMLRALALALLATWTLKVLTGRPAPLLPAAATDFRIGSLGPLDPWVGRVMWPSGHTAAAVSVAAAFAALVRTRRWLAAVVWAVAFLVAAAMVVWTWHWASDVVAGALVGIGARDCAMLLGRHEPPGPARAAPA